MQPMKMFLDTHDRAHQSFPAEIGKAQFAEFFALYEEAARQEGVVILRVHVGLEAGRAFCLTLAESADAVKRAHARVGLPFDEITEVLTATPGDLFFTPRG
jgi:hypothetical protein